MNLQTPTVHIDAVKGQIAQTVIMPGDPLRAKKFAKKFLKRRKLVSSVRNNFCITGNYKGAAVSIMSSGMGNASMGIYSHELYNFYDVDNIIRVGTTGSLDKSIIIGDILAGERVFTDTNFGGIFASGAETSFVCSKKLLSEIKLVAKEQNIKVICDSIYSTDTFYDTHEKNRHMITLGVKGVEMESAALYFNALKAKKNALTLCTVSDEVLTNKKSTAKQRENDYQNMCLLALEVAVKLHKNIKGK